MIYWICHILLWLPIKIFFPTKVIGKKNLPYGNFVGVCNHYTNVDVILLNINVKRFFYLSKKEMFRTKLKSWFMRHMGAFPVDRNNVDISAIKFGLKTLKEGKQFMMFPEGTRNKTEDKEHLAQVKQGAIMFASKSGKQVVPFLMDKPPRIFRRTRIIIGEPFEIIGENANRLTKEEMDANTDILVSKMDALRDELNKNIK